MTSAPSTPYSLLLPEEKERFFGVWPAEPTAAERSLHLQIESYCRIGSLLHAYIVQRSLLFKAAPLPEGVHPMAKRECFRNATQLVFDRRDELAYVEGIALSTAGLSTSHAWCVRRDGTVVDPTWDSPESCVYLGIPMESSFLLTRMNSTGVYGVFGEMASRELLSTPISEMVHPWFQQHIAARPVWPELERVLGAPAS